VTWRPGAIAVARALNGLYFLAVAAYCFVAYTPFVYELFLKPGVVPALSDFVAVSPLLFSATLLITILTLMPQLTGAGARGRVVARTYVVASGLVALIALFKSPLVSIGNTPRAFAVGLAAVAWPAWLATVDHLIWPAPQIRRTDSRRVLVACVLSAVVACSVYALVSPFLIDEISGVDLSAGVLAGGIGSSLILNLYAFMALFLAIVAMTGISSAFRLKASAEYWLLLLLLVVCGSVVMYQLVCASLQFSGAAAWACSVAFAGGTASVWANIARLRSQPIAVVNDQPEQGGRSRPDSVELFTAPLLSGRSRAAAISLLVLLPVIAYAVIDGIRHFDWNFLFQKISVLIVWLLAFASTYALADQRAGTRRSSLRLAVMPLVALALYAGLMWIDPATAMDRYAAVDPSLRMIRDARTSRSSGTADFYRFLASQSLVGSSRVQPSVVDFVRPLRATDRKPPIFLFIVDSLRRDYLSPYNPRVTFTPEIGKLAADSFVFERAWTRYSGTALAIPAIWTGGMVPHMVLQHQFPQRNTLLKLLEANEYERLMDIDVHVEALVTRDDRMVNLDPHRGTMDLDMCATVPELERRLSDDRRRPVFFYSLSQNVHLAVAPKRPVPSGETYPAGFNPRTASSLRRLDACLGSFVKFLKQEHLYDDSIIVLTSDHGDSLGEEGRWGHAFWMYPEVMSIPLIVHIPSRLKPLVRADLDALVFSTDIVPSLYTLLGYEPKDLGPLFGRSFFTPRDGDSSRRRRERYLVASSYGAVYGVLSQNGRRIYVVDTVNRSEYALDMTAQPHNVEVTPPVAAVNRRFMQQQLSTLAAVYHYKP
jgi:Sulfatase